MNKKNLSAFAVFFAASFVFTACDRQGSANASTTGTDSTAVVTAGNRPASMNIVYIDTDSLINGYGMFKDLSTKYGDKANKVQQELETKSKAWERKVTDLQEKASKGLITRSQGEEMQNNLAKEQQDIIQYRDKVLAELQEEEQVMFNNVRHNIDEYLKRYNAEKKYDLILSTNNISNAVMVGNPALDITTEVLEAMNKEYTDSLKNQGK